MMKKVGILIIILVIIGLLNIRLCITKPLFDFASNTFWNFIAEQLEKEEQERLAAIERGEIIIGKDTMLVWNDKYVLYHQAGNDTLCIHHSDGINESIIGKVRDYKKKSGSLYIVSDEGYVVIDDNNLCRVYITVPKEEFVRGYAEDESGTRTYFSKFIEDENIQYLDSFESFSEDEQKMLTKLKN